MAGEKMAFVLPMTRNVLVLRVMLCLASQESTSKELFLNMSMMTITSGLYEEL